MLAEARSTVTHKETAHSVRRLTKTRPLAAGGATPRVGGRLGADGCLRNPPTRDAYSVARLRASTVPSVPRHRSSGTAAPCASAVSRMVGWHRRGPRPWVRSELCRAEHARSAGPAGCDRCTASWRDAPCACGPPAACSPHVAASNAHNAFWAPGGPCLHVRSAKWRHRIAPAHDIPVDSPPKLSHILERSKVYAINLYF